MVSTWIAHQIFEIFDSDRIFEQMDRIELEERLQECHVAFPRTPMLVAMGVGGVYATWKFSKWAGLIGVGTLAAAVIVYGEYCRRKIRAIRKLTWQMERTRAAMRRRKQIYFSISMRLPSYRNPLILRSCRLAVGAIEILIEETQTMTSSESTWQDMYSDEILMITSRSEEDSEKLKIEELEEGSLDFDTVFETLIAVFKLHASEFCRHVILDFLNRNSPKSLFRKIRDLLKTCSLLDSISRNLEILEKLALGNKNSEDAAKRNGEKLKMKMSMEIGWKQQTTMALEAILENLSSEDSTRQEIESSLRRALLILAPDSSESSSKIQKSEFSENKNFEGPEDPEEVIRIEKGQEDRNDIDMVFEGTTLSEAEKRGTAPRDALLDGSESRKHEKSLFGELKMVLEPRRSDFAKRERTALAKFYGVEENQLEQEEKEEESFEGIATGQEDPEPEPYDWRTDAENSAGIHREAGNDDFLKALMARKVDDDIIE